MKNKTWYTLYYFGLSQTKDDKDSLQKFSDNVFCYDLRL